MTDIVERLRKHDPDKWCIADTDTGTLVREAADEIERLQEAKRAALKIADERSKENCALRQEIERLRAAKTAASIDAGNKHEPGRNAQIFPVERNVSNKLSNIAENGV